MARTFAKLTKDAKVKEVAKAFAKLRGTIEKDPWQEKLRKAFAELRENIDRYLRDRRRQLRTPGNEEVEEWFNVDVVVSPDDRVSIRYGEGEALEFHLADVPAEARLLVEKLVYSAYRLAELFQGAALLALSDIEREKQFAHGRDTYRDKKKEQGRKRRRRIHEEDEKLLALNPRLSKLDRAKRLANPKLKLGSQESIRKILK